MTLCLVGSLSLKGLLRRRCGAKKAGLTEPWQTVKGMNTVQMKRSYLTNTSDSFD